MGREVNPKREEIRRMYTAGVMRKDIAAACGVALTTVTYHTQDLRQHRVYKDPARQTMKAVTLPVGNVGLMKALSPEQARRLEGFAMEWECATLAEAALELIRDGLEEVA